MGIVLIYRSSRVINFAVGDLGVPAAGPARHHGRRSTTGPTGWRSIAALAVGTLSGAVVELAVIRRLFHAPRVIVLVATIGVAELAQAVVRALPELPDGDVLQTTYPSPDPRPVGHRRRRHR